MPELSLIVPTYNERENIAPLFQRIATAISDFELIFVDDNSPDGTVQAIRDLQSIDARVKLLWRPGKMGLGSAIRDGLKLAQGEYIGMMDADLSHDAATLPAMIAAFSQADIVIGSRYVKGGEIVGWPLSRQVVSRLAILLARILLRLPARDATSGFALYRRQVLVELRSQLTTSGYKLLMEVLAKSPRARVAEVPITFVNRARGKSKLKLEEIAEFLRLCWRLRRYRRS